MLLCSLLCAGSAALQIFATVSRGAAAPRTPRAIILSSHAPRGWSSWGPKIAIFFAHEALRKKSVLDKTSKEKRNFCGPNLAGTPFFLNVWGTSKTLGFASRREPLALHVPWALGFCHENLLGGAKEMTPAGLEPAIPGSVGRCLIHWATGPMNTFLDFPAACRSAP